VVDFFEWDGEWFSVFLILVDGYGRALLADMGCATTAGTDDTTSQAARFFMTPFTAAPEQLTEGQPFTPAVDIWALGVVLYYVRYQCHPFAAADASVMELLAAIASRELSFPEPDGDAGSDRTRLWLARLLEKEPSRGYQDAREVLRDLRTILAKLERDTPRARAFVAMPFSSELDGLWRFIESVCVECEIHPVRVDEAITQENFGTRFAPSSRRRT
jgi:serine/threonine protein kinase